MTKYAPMHQCHHWLADALRRVGDRSNRPWLGWFVRVILGVLRGMWFGLLATLVVVLGAIVFEARYGPLYGTWDWREISLALLVIVISLLAGAVATIRQPNPYSRSNPLYGLLDVSPNRDLDSGGSGWMLQAAPPVAAIIVLAASFFL